MRLFPTSLSYSRLHNNTAYKTLQGLALASACYVLVVLTRSVKDENLLKQTKVTYTEHSRKSCSFHCFERSQTATQILKAFRNVTFWYALLKTNCNNSRKKLCVAVMGREGQSRGKPISLCFL